MVEPDAIAGTSIARIYIAVEVQKSVPCEESNWPTKTDPRHTAFCLNPWTLIDSLLPSIKTASLNLVLRQLLSAGCQVSFRGRDLKELVKKMWQFEARFRVISHFRLGLDCFDVIIWSFSHSPSCLFPVSPCPVGLLLSHCPFHLFSLFIMTDCLYYSVIIQATLFPSPIIFST